MPAIGFEAVVDVVWAGKIGKDPPPATFIVDDRDLQPRAEVRALRRCAGLRCRVLCDADQLE